MSPTCPASCCRAMSYILSICCVNSEKLGMMNFFLKAFVSSKMLLPTHLPEDTSYAYTCQLVLILCHNVVRNGTIISETHPYKCSTYRFILLWSSLVKHFVHFLSKMKKEIIYIIGCTLDWFNCSCREQLQFRLGSLPDHSQNTWDAYIVLPCLYPRHLNLKELIYATVSHQEESKVN